MTAGPAGRAGERGDRAGSGGAAAPEGSVGPSEGVGDRAVPVEPFVAFAPAVPLVGVDVVDVARLDDMLARNPALIDRLFLPEERDLPSASRAARAAAKEAVGKALGNPEDLSWHDVRVRRDGGAPRVELAGGALSRARDLGVQAVAISLSHDAGLAIAVVRLETDPRGGPDDAPGDAGARRRR